MSLAPGRLPPGEGTDFGVQAQRVAYEFSTAGAVVGRFAVNLDPAGQALPLPARTLPAWALLENQQCPDCPLAGSGSVYCPMAAALVEVQEFAAGADSFSVLRVRIDMAERRSEATVPLQRALSSLMGLLIATCHCPDVAWLRPMARFHLPLASEEETIYRATSMYLMAQYFRRKAGAEPDLDLRGLQARYHRLHQINLAMAARLREAVGKDASINAVVLLDMFAKALPWSVADSVSELERLFRPYLDT